MYDNFILTTIILERQYEATAVGNAALRGHVLMVELVDNRRSVCLLLWLGLRIESPV